jgi:hypothetical protein
MRGERGWGATTPTAEETNLSEGKPQSRRACSRIANGLSNSHDANCWRSVWEPTSSRSTYCMSLPEDRRAGLRDRLKATLPSRADGSIHLTARAFAIHGTKAQSDGR